MRSGCINLNGGTLNVAGIGFYEWSRLAYLSDSTRAYGFNFNISDIHPSYYGNRFFVFPVGGLIWIYCCLYVIMAESWKDDRLL